MTGCLRGCLHLIGWALALILGSAVAAYHGLISTLAAVGLMALAGACCLVVEWVRWRR